MLKCYKDDTQQKDAEVTGNYMKAPCHLGRVQEEEKTRKLFLGSVLSTRMSNVHLSSWAMLTMQGTGQRLENVIGKWLSKWRNYLLQHSVKRKDETR